MTFRLHIDIPLNMTEEDALMASQQILGILADVDTDAILRRIILLNAIGVEEISSRTR